MNTVIVPHRTLIYDLGSNENAERFDEARQKQGLPPYFFDPEYGQNLVRKNWLVDMADLSNLEMAFLAGMNCSYSTGLCLPWKPDLCESSFFHKLFEQSEKRQYCVWPSQKILFLVDDLALSFLAACSSLTNTSERHKKALMKRSLMPLYTKQLGELDNYMAWIANIVPPLSSAEDPYTIACALLKAQIPSDHQWNLWEMTRGYYIFEYQRELVFEHVAAHDLLASVNTFLEKQNIAAEVDSFLNDRVKPSDV